MSKTDGSFNAEQYATVADRIELFYSRFPEGRINTELVSREDGEITFKALVYRGASDTLAAATGWASELEGDGEVTAVACLENTETSAVGRALANLGFTASARRPSREEMEKVERVRSVLDHGAHQNGNGDLRAKGKRDLRLDGHAGLHAQANAADDVLRLLSKAELKGLPPKRAEILRNHVNRYPGLEPARVRKIETTLRTWIRRREL